MRHDNAISALHEALAAAVHRDLPDIEYEQKRYEKWDSKTHGPSKFPDFKIEVHARRPFGSEIEVQMFEQLWGSTALGYGGLRGAAMTYAYTVICSLGDIKCVYFGSGRLAYRVDYSKMTADQRVDWHFIINDKNFPNVHEALNKFKGAINT